MRYTHSLSKMPLSGLTAYELIIERDKAFTTGSSCEAYAVILFNEAGESVPDVAQVLHVPAEGRLVLVWRETSVQLEGDSVEAAIHAWVVTQRHEHD